MLLKHFVMCLAYEYSGINIVAEIFAVLGSCRVSFGGSLVTVQDSALVLFSGVKMGLIRCPIMHIIN